MDKNNIIKYGAILAIFIVLVYIGTGGNFSFFGTSSLNKEEAFDTSAKLETHAGIVDLTLITNIKPSVLQPLSHIPANMVWATGSVASTTPFYIENEYTVGSDSHSGADFPWQSYSNNNLVLTMDGLDLTGTSSITGTGTIPSATNIVTMTPLVAGTSGNSGHYWGNTYQFGASPHWVKDTDVGAVISSGTQLVSSTNHINWMFATFPVDKQIVKYSINLTTLTAGRHILVIHYMGIQSKFVSGCNVPASDSSSCPNYGDFNQLVKASIAGNRNRVITLDFTKNSDGSITYNSFQATGGTVSNLITHSTVAQACPLTSSNCLQGTIFSLPTCSCNAPLPPTGCQLTSANCGSGTTLNTATCSCNAPPAPICALTQANCIAPTTFNSALCGCQAPTGCLLTQANCGSGTTLNETMCGCQANPVTPVNGGLNNDQLTLIGMFVGVLIVLALIYFYAFKK